MIKYEDMDITRNFPDDAKKLKEKLAAEFIRSMITYQQSEKRGAYWGFIAGFESCIDWIVENWHDGSSAGPEDSDYIERSVSDFIDLKERDDYESPFKATIKPFSETDTPQINLYSYQWYKR